MKNFIIALLIGLLFIGGGIWAIINSNRLMAECTEEVTGVVVDYYESYDNVEVSTTEYFPIIEYQVGDKKVSNQSKSSYTSKKFNLGDSVKILYNPNKTNEFIIKGDDAGKTVGILVICIGAFMTIIVLYRFFIKHDNF